MLRRDELESQLILQHQLKALTETLHQQLLETEKRQREELEKRIKLNATLSTHMDRESTDCPNSGTGLRKVASTSASNFDKRTTHEHIRPNSTDWNHVYKSPQLKHTRTYNCERAALAITGPSKDEEAMAECLKKFCALPVPSHVSEPLFEEMMAKREKQRKQDHEQRKNFLLSIQRPFNFQQRQNDKREKLIAMMKESKEDQINAISKPQVIQDSDSKLAQREFRKVNTQKTMQDRNSSVLNGPKLRTAERNRKKKMTFLDERPSFQPKIIRHVPDFIKIHKALQTEPLRKTQTNDMTKCQPFHLRTSALPVRQRRMSPQSSQVPKVVHLSRSKSLGALTLLSTDTLPVYITDAARKRSMAIRKSMEIRESKNQESADWMRKHQMRSEAMKRTVTLHAKLLDPHRSLKEVYNEKLQHHQEADQQRMREYTRELRGMKARVSERPYLFEQVKQKSAKANAEKVYLNTLKSAGLKEQFVEENGEAAVTGSSASSISEENTHGSTKGSRAENVADGEKIEDVKEESVNYKDKEMP